MKNPHHDLCIDPDTYAEVISGNQPFLIVSTGFERPFQHGETIQLNELNGCIPTGRQCFAEIGQVSSHLQPEGQVVIGLLNVTVTVT
jgi:hypothetical protein